MAEMHALVLAGSAACPHFGGAEGKERCIRLWGFCCLPAMGRVVWYVPSQCDFQVFFLFGNGTRVVAC